MDWRSYSEYKWKKEVSQNLEKMQRILATVPQAKSHPEISSFSSITPKDSSLENTKKVNVLQNQFISYLEPLLSVAEAREYVSRFEREAASLRKEAKIEARICGGNEDISLFESVCSPEHCVMVSGKISNYTDPLTGSRSGLCKYSYPLKIDDFVNCIVLSNTKQLNLYSTIQCVLQEGSIRGLTKDNISSLLMSICSTQMPNYIAAVSNYKLTAEEKFKSILDLILAETDLATINKRIKELCRNPGLAIRGLVNALETLYSDLHELKYPFQTKEEIKKKTDKEILACLSSYLEDNTREEYENYRIHCGRTDVPWTLSEALHFIQQIEASPEFALKTPKTLNESLMKPNPLSSYLTSINDLNAPPPPKAKGDTSKPAEKRVNVNKKKKEKVGKENKKMKKTDKTEKKDKKPKDKANKKLKANYNDNKPQKKKSAKDASKEERKPSPYCRTCGCLCGAINEEHCKILKESPAKTRCSVCGYGRHRPDKVKCAKLFEKRMEDAADSLGN